MLLSGLISPEISDNSLENNSEKIISEKYPLGEWEIAKSLERGFLFAKGKLGVHVLSELPSYIVDVQDPAVDRANLGIARIRHERRATLNVATIPAWHRNGGPFVLMNVPV